MANKEEQSIVPLIKMLSMFNTRNRLYFRALYLFRIAFLTLSEESVLSFRLFMTVNSNERALTD